MSALKDLLTIKKIYGEAMMKFCRTNFANILDYPGRLPKIFSTYFAENKHLLNDIVLYKKEFSFIQYILSKSEDLNDYPSHISDADPFESLSQVGYNLTHCKTIAEFYAFEKYYAAGEAICSFNNAYEVMKNNHVFFITKKNIDGIKRSDFQAPTRQDEYGTSCMCVQFAKTEDKLSNVRILNRYNSTVMNADATFGNKLDNIVPGLESSFETYLDIYLTAKNEFEIVNYTQINGQKFYKVNHEINNIYYLPDNKIIRNNQLTEFSKDDYVVADYFVICKNKKTGLSVSLFDMKLDDGLLDQIGEIDSITDQLKTSKKGEKIRVLTLELKNKNTVVIKLDKYNRIISFSNPNSKVIGDNFLRYNTTLKELDTPNVEVIKEKAFLCNNSLKHLRLPKLIEMDKSAFAVNTVMETFDAPSLNKGVPAFLKK